MFAIGVGQLFRVGVKSRRIRTSYLRGPTLLKSSISVSSTGLSPSKERRSRQLQLTDEATELHHISASLSQGDSVCPIPFSLAANGGITIVFFSCRY